MLSSTYSPTKLPPPTQTSFQTPPISTTRSLVTSPQSKYGSIQLPDQSHKRPPKVQYAANPQAEKTVAKPFNLVYSGPWKLVALIDDLTYISLVISIVCIGKLVKHGRATPLAMLSDRRLRLKGPRTQNPKECRVCYGTNRRSLTAQCLCSA